MNRACTLTVLAVTCIVGCAFELHFDASPQAAESGADAPIAGDSELGAAHDTAHDPGPGPPTSPPNPVGPPDTLPVDDARPPDAQPPVDVSWVDTPAPVDAKGGG